LIIDPPIEVVNRILNPLVLKEATGRSGFCTKLAMCCSVAARSLAFVLPGTFLLIDLALLSRIPC